MMNLEWERNVENDVWVYFHFTPNGFVKLLNSDKDVIDTRFQHKGDREHYIEIGLIEI